MFDCVLPTRNGRNANLFTRNGRINIRNAVYAGDPAPVDELCRCYTCRTFSRGYLRHLFRCGEILGLQLASIHNLTFYLWLVTEARQAIVEQRFAAWKEQMLAGLGAGARKDLDGNVAEQEDNTIDHQSNSRRVQ
jgi:queuine tRNA-ribosyltransferase